MNILRTILILDSFGSTLPATEVDPRTAPCILLGNGSYISLNWIIREGFLVRPESCHFIWIVPQGAVSLGRNRYAVVFIPQRSTCKLWVRAG